MPRRLNGVAETNQIGVAFVRKNRRISLIPRREPIAAAGERLHRRGSTSAARRRGPARAGAHSRLCGSGSGSAGFSAATGSADRERRARSAAFAAAGAPRPLRRQPQKRRPARAGALSSGHPVPVADERPAGVWAAEIMEGMLTHSSTPWAVSPHRGSSSVPGMRGTSVEASACTPPVRVAADR